MLTLSLGSIKLLLKCLEKHRKDLLWVISDKKLIKVNEELGNELREAVSDELIEQGFDDNSPNQYGLELEKLIDEIARLFM